MNFSFVYIGEKDYFETCISDLFINLASACANSIMIEKKRKGYNIMYMIWYENFLLHVLIIIENKNGPPFEITTYVEDTIIKFYLKVPQLAKSGSFY